MLSPALGRAFRTSCAACASVSSATSRPTALGITASTTQNLTNRSLHQRRYSSSKPSTPSDGSTGPAPQTPTNASAKSTVKKASNRSSRKRQPTLPTVNLPRVPPTHHLRRADVDLSSFFSLHRPISVTTAIPPTSSEASFNEIFEPRAQEKQKYANVIFTLSETVDALENGSHPEADDAFAASPNAVVHLDGVPATLDIDRLIAQYRPFRPPPPPVSFDEQGRKKKASPKQKRRESSRRASAQSPQKSWSTTIVVTESTNPNGTRTYTASSSPMVEIPIPTSGNVLEPIPEAYSEIQQPFLERMRVRQQRWMEYRHDRTTQQRGEMQLISVKRQRKLKMKKHKYKKLMKRTRTLRRKLNRA